MNMQMTCPAKWNAWQRAGWTLAGCGQCAGPKFPLYICLDLIENYEEKRGHFLVTSSFNRRKMLATNQPSGNVGGGLHGIALKRLEQVIKHQSDLIRTVSQSGGHFHLKGVSRWIGSVKRDTLRLNKTIHAFKGMKDAADDTFSQKLQENHRRSGTWSGRRKSWDADSNQPLFILNATSL